MSPLSLVELLPPSVPPALLRGEGRLLRSLVEATPVSSLERARRSLDSGFLNFRITPLSFLVGDKASGGGGIISLVEECELFSSAASTPSGQPKK